ncbi:MAG TPA: hypothetical protein H9881_00400 [Candidatus Stackebrandtia excrementipullorum]|nr:hypothetical protein [Candidatus Stackebrandtia excrementipullorum]
MRRRTGVIVAAVLIAAAVFAFGSGDGVVDVECHPWRKHYLGAFEQREGPGVASTVRFLDGHLVEGVGASAGTNHSADGSGTWRVGEDNLVEWTIEGTNRLDTGAQVQWRPTYTATSVQCDDAGRVIRITGNGTDTAPFPSRFDFVRVE